MRRSPHLVTPVLVLALAIAGCKAPLNRAGTFATHPAASPPSVTGGGTTSLNDGGVISQGGAKLAADGLTGLVSAPAGIVAQGGGNIVASGGGNIVASGGGNIVASGGGNYRLAEAGSAPVQKPLAGAKVTVVDAAGTPIMGPDGKPLETTTDANGRYTFAHGVPARAVRVVVDLGAAGRLAGLTPKNRLQPQLDLDLASTFMCVYIVNHFVKPQADPLTTLDRLTPDVADATTKAITAALAAAGIPLPAKLDAAHVTAAVEMLRRQDHGVDQQMEAVRKLLVVGSASVAVSDGPARQAVVTPLGVAADGKGNVFFTDARLVRKLTPDGRVVTLAGNGSWGSTDGPGTAASFSDLGPIALDGAGNVYVSDPGNGEIRKIAPDGTVGTLATSDLFGQVVGLAADAAGNVYVLEGQPQQLQKIAPDGTVSLLAGSGKAGTSDGRGAAASFEFPGALALDGHGTLYVMDGSDKIRKVASDGTVTTLALAAPFDDGVEGLAADASGNLVVASGPRLYRLDAAGKSSVLAGAATPGKMDGAGEAASFDTLAGLTFDAAGNLFVADIANNLIRKVTPDGSVTTVAGSGEQAVGGTGTSALFSHVGALAWNATQALYVFDDGAHRFDKVVNGNVTALPASTADAHPFDGVRGLAVAASGDVFFTDSNAQQVRKLAADGTLSTVATGFAQPTAIVLDAKGTLYVHDVDAAGKGLIRTVAADGTTRTLGPSGVTSPNPDAFLAVDAAGAVYACDAENRKIYKLAPGATTATLLAGNDQHEAIDGVGANASFDYPWGIAVDAAGNLYVADLGVSKVRRVAPDGTVSTLDVPLPANAGLGAPIAVNGTTLTFCSDRQLFSVPLPH